MTGYITLVWVIWGALFLAFEFGGWLLVGPQATLTQRWRAWFHVLDARPTWLTWLMRSLLLPFLVWLYFHLAWGWWG